MRLADVTRFAGRSLAGYRLRTLLTMLAISIGVGAVVVLTALGEGARGYVRNKFSELGSNLIIIFPGRPETAGGAPGALMGRTPRDLTLDDALILLRIPGVRRVAPLVLGDAEVSVQDRSREVPVLGSTADLLEVRHLTMAEGSFLPVEDPRRPTSVCVIGWKVRQELFGSQPAVGSWVRIGDRRFRVVGVLTQQGESLGLDIDEIVILPVASAQAVFNLPSLLRILIEARRHEDLLPEGNLTPAYSARTTELRSGNRCRVCVQIADLLRGRHEGEEDFTVVTQDAVLAGLDRITLRLTLALAGIASISLAVAGILIMNVMLIAVTQRTAEIGLLKALGASPGQIRLLFFAEAVMLSVLGALLGSVLGEAGSYAIRWVYPQLPAFPPGWAVAAALATALATGILFSLLPARRAARLEPALALARR